MEGAGISFASETRVRDDVPHWLDAVTLVLLSVAALATAWCTYQAELWSGIQAEKYTLAGERNVDAALANATAGQQQMVDLGMFMNWLGAYVEGRRELTSFYEARFRPEFRPAFRAWMATEPRANPAAPPSPFVMADYRLADHERARTLSADATRSLTEGRDANARSDTYVLDTVLLASVLFLAGIAQQMQRMTTRKVVTGVALFLLVTAIVHIAMSPLAPV